MDVVCIFYRQSKDENCSLHKLSEIKFHLPREIRHFFDQRCDNVFFFDAADHHAFAVKNSHSFAGGNANVCFGGFAGAIHHAAEQRDFHRLLDMRDGRF